MSTHNLCFLIAKIRKFANLSSENCQFYSCKNHSILLRHVRCVHVMMNNFIYVQLREDIQGVENAFSDLHRRYEKLKMVVEGNLKVCYTGWDNRER